MLSQYRRIGSSLEQWAADATHYRNALWIIFVLALALRVVTALVHPFYLPDSTDYAILAKAIATGHAWEIRGQFAHRMPGYPFFLAGFYKISGFHNLPVFLAQAILGALTSMFSAILGRYVSPATGLVAGIITALDPLGIGFAASLLSETLFTCLFILSLLIFLHLIHWLSAGNSTWRKGQWGLWFCFAVLWSAAIYVRAEVALCIFPLLALGLYAARNNNGRWKSVVGSIMVLLVVFLCLLPWWVRNYSIFHQDFFRFSTLQGISLYESVYSGATGGPRQSDLVIPPSIKRLNESQRDLAWTHRAFNEIFQHPGRMIRLAFVKVARTWSPWLHAKGYANPWLNVLLTIWYCPMFILAFIGLYRLSWRLPLFGILLIPIVYFTCMHAVFIGSVRYRIPVMPLVAVLAAIGMAQRSVWHSDAGASDRLGAES